MATVAAQDGIRRLRTPGIIAAELGVALHRVTHVLRTRKYIQPIARAGTLRLYTLEAVAMIRHELNAIDARAAEVAHV
jgi:hypothetical protein